MIFQHWKKISGIIFCAFLISSCAPLPLKEIKQKVASPVDTSEKLAPLLFDRIQFRIKRGTAIGRYYGLGVFCSAPFGNVTWGSGRLSGRSLEFADIFYEEMTSAAFDVVGSPGRLFNVEDDYLRAEYKIGGQVQELKLNLCNQVNLIGIHTGVSGDGYVKIKWKIYSNAERRVVYTVTTEGRGKSENPSTEGGSVALNNAFASSVANFSTDPKLRAILSRKQNPVIQKDWVASSENEILFRKSALYTSDISEHINEVRSATVTVGSGLGHGSGFFISDEGLIITNNHVVGGARFVRIQLVNGREIAGEVLRRRKRRDVALILVEGKGYQPLPVRREPLRVTEDVFAVGSPRMRDLSTTVSKGVVSAFRNFRNDNLNYIQADVDIHGGNSGGPLVDAKGNLVGISVAGLGSSGDKTKSSVGLNFFIPIDEALKALNLKAANLPKNHSVYKKLRKSSAN